MHHPTTRRISGIGHRLNDTWSNGELMALVQERWAMGDRFTMHAREWH